MNTTDRKDTYTIRDDGVPLCDNGLTKGWYRFEGDAGTRMLTTCVNKNRCATHSPGWLYGAHPTMEESKVKRVVYFGASPNCESYHQIIKVKNCSSYYVYELDRTSGCNQRFCGTD